MTDQNEKNFPSANTEFRARIRPKYRILKFKQKSKIPSYREINFISVYPSKIKWWNGETGSFDAAE